MLKGNLITPQELYTSSLTAGTDVGAKAETGDGRVFRYAKAGAANLTAGTLIQSPAVDTTNMNVSGGLVPIAVASATAKTTSLAIGSTCVAVGKTSSTYPSLTAQQQDNLIGGYLTVILSTGAGYNYKIASVYTVDVSGTGPTYVTLEEPLKVAITVAASKLTLGQNPYRGVIVAPATTATGSPVGFAIHPLTTLYYGWLQTHGPVAVNGTGGTGVGLALMPGSGTAGSLITQTAGSPIVAHALTTGVTTEYDLVFACIE